MSRLSFRSLVTGAVFLLPPIAGCNPSDTSSPNAPSVGAAATPIAANGARFAAVTNQRVMVTPPPGLVSRGLAVIETAAAPDPDAYVAALDATRYASMNLVWGDSRGAQVAYTRREEGTVDVLPLGRGVHVLCNDRIGAEGFPRGERLALSLAPLVGAPLADVLAALPALLGDHTRLPDSSYLDATCIHSEHYGTRSSTILALAQDRVLAYLHADGTPCTTPFVDRSDLL